MGARRVQVIQSHREPLPAAWYATCIDSVRQWAATAGFEYHWLGDELFGYLDAELLEKTIERPVVAADLARLCALEGALATGFDQAIWVDADVLVLSAAEFELPESGALFGREVWVQGNGAGTLKVYRKVHNAFMAFARGDPVLPFYRHSAERILRRFEGPMVAQLIGPKLLTLLHNAIGFDVLETAGMLSPAVAKDLLAGGGRALQRFVLESDAEPLALNLCGSAVTSGELSDAEMTAVVRCLDSQRAGSDSGRFRR